MLQRSVSLPPRRLAAVGAGAADEHIGAALCQAVKQRVVGCADGAAQVGFTRAAPGVSLDQILAVAMKSAGFNRYLRVEAPPSGKEAPPLCLADKSRTWELLYARLDQLRAYARDQCPSRPVWI